MGTDRWDEFEEALDSGDTDRVNAAIDEIAECDLDERLQLFEDWFDDLTALYARHDDGYVRQSTVRAADQLAPGLAVAVATVDGDPSIPVDNTDVRAQTDAIAGFLLEAITDDDGRVRQSAVRGFKSVFRTYDALDDTETIDALADELERLATSHTGTRRDHLREAKADAEFCLQSGFGRMLDGIDTAFDDALQE